MPKVSVIIPIYNVEKYIERCARSLMEQTLDDIEYIFVNDATPDRSMEILNRVVEEYPQRKGQCIFINNSENHGQAFSRNIAMQKASGIYQIHCDADDWVELEMYKEMYDLAIDGNCDIVSCGFICEGQKEFNKIYPVKETDPHKYINSKRLSGGLTIRLIKSELINKYGLFPIEKMDYGEDKYIILRAYFYSKRVNYINNLFYHYNMDNVLSITKRTLDPSIIAQQRLCVELITSFFHQNRFNYKYELVDKIETRSLFLAHTPPMMKEFQSTFPEITQNVFYDKSYTLAYRLCYRMANKGIFFPMLLYLRLSGVKNSFKSE